MNLETITINGYGFQYNAEYVENLEDKLATSFVMAELTGFKIKYREFNSHSAGLRIEFDKGKISFFLLFDVIKETKVLRGITIGGSNGPGSRVLKKSINGGSYYHYEREQMKRIPGYLERIIGSKFVDEV